MATTTKEVQAASVVVEEELRRINAPQLKREIQGLSWAVIALGAIEILLGAFAVSLPFITSAFFVLLLGATVLGGGLFQIVNSAAHRSWGRFFLGLVSAVAGLLILGHPLFGLAFLTLLIGSYLIASGIVRLGMAGGSGWEIFGGIAGIVLGVLILLGWPAVSNVVIGLFVGVNLIVGGVTTFLMGSRLQSAVLRTEEKGAAHK